MVRPVARPEANGILPQAPQRPAQHARACGRYEWAALPSFGGTVGLATLDDALEHSFLTVDDPFVFARMGTTRLGFRLRMGGDASKATFTTALLDTHDVAFAGGATVRAHASLILVALADRLHLVRIWLTAERVRSTDLVLGRNALSGRWAPDPAVSFALRTPSHSLVVA